MKKQYILIILAFFAVATSKAQQLPLYSNYIFTPYVFNPAMSGLNGVTEVAVVNRRQWTGVQGAPITTAIMANGDLADQKFGWSAYAYNDQTDIVSRSAIYGSYAYHVKFSEKNSISLGLSAGYMNNSIDQSGINVGDDSDPLLYANLNDGATFDINFGVSLKLGDFTLGAAAPQLLAPAVVYSNNYDGPIQYQLIRHYIVNTQYDIQMQNGKMILSPFAVLRAADGVSPQVDAGLMFNMTDYFFVGAAYRSSYAVTANAGVHLTENLTFGYAYDFSTSEFGYDMGRSHEFMLRWRFGASKKDKRLENEIKKLKDKQNRSSEETEELVNERLDEFKDEIRRENAKTLEEQKKELMNEVMVLYDPSNPNNPNRNNNNTVPANNQNTNNNNSPSNNGPNNNNNVSPESTSTIKGYPENAYASKVAPGSKGYYVTAGVFGSENNARKLMQRLQSQNIDVNIFKDNANGMFYVFIMKFGNYELADQAKTSGLNGQYNGKLWVKVVE
jgi:type IX secretion system PorP/SprF family membrane protein